jgi:glucose dehydrogenase
MKSRYKVGFDWPISYRDIEPWYVRAEYEMGVAGSDAENRNYYERKFGAYRSKKFPMPALVPSYIDKELGEAINDKPVPKHGLRLHGAQRCYFRIGDRLPKTALADDGACRIKRTSMP